MPFQVLREHLRRPAVAWYVLALMIAGGIWFVTVYGFTMPHVDEWLWVPVVVGKEPVTLSWLWSLFNEHRMFLPRLIYLGLGALTHFNFRAGAYYNILTLSGLSFAMMWVARRLRGHTIAYDAFFPLVLLHWAQCENIVWGFQLNFITAVVLAGAVLLAIARCGPRLAVLPALFVTVCLTGLGLCGLYGLAYLPALACWLLFAGGCRWREATLHHRRDGLLLMFFGLAPLALVGGYFVDFPFPVCQSSNVSASLVTACQFLSGGMGRAAKETWPVSGLIVPSALIYSLGQLYQVFRTQPQERLRAAGLFCFLGGVGSLTLAIAMGRPGCGFETRYMTLAAPLMCLFYLQFTLYGAPAVKVRLQHALALLMWILLVINTQKGLCFARSYVAPWPQFEHDVRCGLSTSELASRYDQELGLPLSTDVFAQRLDMLREARLGPYRYVDDDFNVASAKRTNLR